MPLHLIERERKRRLTVVFLDSSEHDYWVWDGVRVGLFREFVSREMHCDLRDFIFSDVGDDSAVRESPARRECRPTRESTPHRASPIASLHLSPALALQEIANGLDSVLVGRFGLPVACDMPRTELEKHLPVLFVSSDSMMPVSVEFPDSTRHSYSVWSETAIDAFRRFIGNEPGLSVDEFKFCEANDEMVIRSYDASLLKCSMMPVSHGCPRLVPSFSADFPETRFRIVFRDGQQIRPRLCPDISAGDMKSAVISLCHDRFLEVEAGSITLCTNHSRINDASLICDLRRKVYFVLPDDQIGCKVVICASSIWRCTVSGLSNVGYLRTTMIASGAVPPVPFAIAVDGLAVDDLTLICLLLFEQMPFAVSYLPASKAAVRSRQISSYVIDPQEFEMVRILGEGASGSVYLMKHRATKEEVAMKTFHAMNQQRQACFLHEIEALIVLGHPLVVSFGGYVLPGDEGCAKIATCFVDGPTLKEVIETSPHWWNPTMKTCAIVGIALGMQAVRSVGIMHWPDCRESRHSFRRII
jgi:hypothetical protein